jgi:hypothetical protein
MRNVNRVNAKLTLGYERVFLFLFTASSTERLGSCDQRKAMLQDKEGSSRLFQVTLHPVLLFARWRVTSIITRAYSVS